MMVLAIIGILVAVAVPSYDNYTRKARVAEGIVQLAPAKAQVAELVAIGKITNSGAIVSASPRQYYQSTSGPSNASSTPSTSSTTSSSSSSTSTSGNDLIAVIATDPTPSIAAVARSGTYIAVTFNTSIDPNGITRYSLVYTGTIGTNGNVTWSCKAGSAATSELQTMALATGHVISATPLPAQWAPASCTT